MQLINFSIILIILAGLFTEIRLSYLISLICSLAAALFIRQQVSLTNILITIAVFNLTPLFCCRFNLSCRRRLHSLIDKKETARARHQELSKQRSLVRHSNFQLSEEVSKIWELYRMTRDMSAVLKIEQIFTILGLRLMKHFRFKRSRLVLIDEEAGPLEIKKVLEVKYNQAHAHELEPQAEDKELLKESLQAQRPAFVEKNSLCLTALVSDGKLLGALGVEGLSAGALEDFSILANQFSLEFRRISLYQKIQKLAITDGLTGLFMRRYFLERLKEEARRCARHNLRLGFLMIDIDHFKQCNDRFGHLTGDVVLRDVAGVINANVREIDLVARYGGEEFSVLLPDTDKEGARQAAERIRQSVARHKFRAYDEVIKVQVSAGAVGFPGDSDRPEELIDRADQALYRAKQEGRNRVCLFKG